MTVTQEGINVISVILFSQLKYVLYKHINIAVDK